MADVRTYTARQINLFYKQVLKRKNLERADRIDDVSLAFTGKLNQSAQAVRKQYE